MKKSAFIITFLFCSFLTMANDKDSSEIINKRIAFITDSIQKAMKWERGTINIANGEASLNGQCLLLCWYFIMSSPEPQPNRITDDEVNNKKLNSNSSAG